MDSVFIIISLIVLGLILGSFAGATVWRLRARQLVGDKADGEPYDKPEYSRLVSLTKRSLKTDRSQCLHCGHELQAIDLIPLVSWLSTGGRCRYCHKPIGKFEPTIEVGMAIGMVVVYSLWPYDVSGLLGGSHLILWLLALVPLGILFAYDLKWFLLPNSVVSATAFIGALVAIDTIVGAEDHLAALLSVIGGIGILSGVYAFLWLISQGKWIGFGDVKLGLGLALLLADWRLSFIALFAANLVGVLIVIPGMLRGTVQRKTEVQFGPLLIIGTLIALLVGQQIMSWYGSLL